MKHRKLFWPLALVLILTASASAERSPNVVFLLADDLGWTDLACYGSDLYETPHLDGLAREGVRFTQAYAMSVCSPTRATILSGKHAARLHFTIWREGTFSPPGRRRLIQAETTHDLQHGETTLAEILKAAGYLCLHVGKWHVGDADHSPETHGFDINIGGTHWGAPTTFFWPFCGSGYFGSDFRYVPGLGVGEPGDYLTDRLTDEAIELIDQAGDRPFYLIDQAGDRPFYLNLWYHNPHTPIHGKPEYVERFRDRVCAEANHRNPDYAAMVYSLDENVGRILQHLEDHDLADNTIVIFASDNGGYVGVDRKSGQTVPATNNAPLRSGKGSLYEGGIRVPLIVRFPGVTPAGSECHEPVSCVDFLPTIVQAAGISQAADADSADDSADDSPGVLDGISFLPSLRDPTKQLDRKSLFFHYPHYYPTTTPVGAVRCDDWKLLEYFEDGHLDLSNLKADPGEQHDLAEQMPDRAESLRAQLAAWRESVGAKLPTPNPDHPR